MSPPCLRPRRLMLHVGCWTMGHLHVGLQWLMTHVTVTRDPLHWTFHEHTYCSTTSLTETCWCCHACNKNEYINIVDTSRTSRDCDEMSSRSCVTTVAPSLGWTTKTSWYNSVFTCVLWLLRQRDRSPDPWPIRICWPFDPLPMTRVDPLSVLLQIGRYRYVLLISQRGTGRSVIALKCM